MKPVHYFHIRFVIVKNIIPYRVFYNKQAYWIRFWLEAVSQMDDHLWHSKIEINLNNYFPYKT